MIVYRICDRLEKDLIFNEKSFQKPGNYFEINHKINTFEYSQNTKFIHFFQDLDSIFLSTSKGKFIYIYDIPENLLEKSYGIGLYYDRFNFKKLEKVKEYVIENKFLKFSYLIKVEEITEYIDVEDFIYNNYINKLPNKEDKLIKCLK